MKDFNRLKYIPYKYQNQIRSLSIPNKASGGINLNNANKFHVMQPLKNINFNNSNLIKNKFLNYQYNNTEINNNINYNNNIKNQKSNTINKTDINYNTNQFKEKLMNNLKDNFNIDKIKNKKAFYLNVNFNLNQNYTIPNINNNKINRSLSVQNYYENKNNINNNNKINNGNKLYHNYILNNLSNNYKKNKITKSLKSINENNSPFLNNKRNNNNKSYTRIITNKSLDNHPKLNINISNANSLTNTNNKPSPKKNLFFFENNNNFNKNHKNINLLTEPMNNTIKNSNMNNNDLVLSNLEFKMKKLLNENKTESKGKNYNIIRKIFEEGINALNITKKEKNFLKIILLKYHELIYAFSQENKILKQSNENLQNLNFTLDKKYLDLDKKYKIVIKENQDKNNKDNDNMLFKSIKDMEFSNNNNDNSYKIEEKYENDNDNVYEILLDKERNSKRTKSENIKKRREENNRLNIDDLDSLYFNDKINNIHCYNSKKNYDKVPKIKYLYKCKN